jgi:glycosyltransferase involved in cell wall biosynthesis
MNSKILFILYYYPPIHSVAVKRNYIISNLLAAKFSQSLVLSSSNSLVLKQDVSLSDVKADYIIPCFDYRNMAQLFSKNKVNHFSEGVKSNRFSQFFIRCINTIPFNILIGEGGILYVFKGYRLSQKLIFDHQITHIYTSFRPFSDHFIGFLLKLKFKSKIHWTADFRDLHVDPIYKNVIFPKLQNYLNKKIFSKADLITTVSQGLASHLNDHNGNVVVVRNGIHPLQSKSSVKNKLFTMTYTGSLFTDERDPSPIFSVVEKLLSSKQMDYLKVKITYAGKDHVLWNTFIEKYNLKSISENLGMVNSDIARKLQFESNVNLLLTSAAADMTGVMTGKFYEYLESQSPILVSINGTNDPEFEEIMEELNLGLIVNSVDPFSASKIENWILEQYEAFLNKESTILKLDVEKLKPYYWTNIIDYLKQRIGA